MKQNRGADCEMTIRRDKAWRGLTASGERTKLGLGERDKREPIWDVQKYGGRETGERRRM